MRTIWTLYGITLAIVLLRLYTQWRVTRSLSLGDTMMAASVLCGTGVLITLTIQHHYGLGRHFFYLNQHQRVMALKYSFSGQPLGILFHVYVQQPLIMLRNGRNHGSDIRTQRVVRDDAAIVWHQQNKKMDPLGNILAISFGQPPYGTAYIFAVSRYSGALGPNETSFVLLEPQGSRSKIGAISWRRYTCTLADFNVLQR